MPKRGEISPSHRSPPLPWCIPNSRFRYSYLFFHPQLVCPLFSCLSIADLGLSFLPSPYPPLRTLAPTRFLQIMADFTTGEEAAAKKASRSFKKYQYRGVELDQLLDLSNEKFIDVSCDHKRRIIGGNIADHIFFIFCIVSILDQYR